MPLSQNEKQALTDKIAQAQRLSDDATDPMTVARLTELILDLEEQLQDKGPSNEDSFQAVEKESLRAS